MGYRFDRSYLENPILEYFRWLRTKVKLQWKYRKKHLRIGYKTVIINTTFGKYNWVGTNVVLSNVQLGDFSYISNGSVVLETRIGKFCSIGPDVKIAPGKHPTHTIVSSHPAIYSNPSYCLKNFAKVDHHNPFRSVLVGNDVWICANVVISDGVKVGDGAIIASNSVVTSDVPEYAIVGGVPARIIRLRFTHEEIDFLNRIKWWDKDLEWIEENAELMLDVKKFMDKYDLQ